MMKFIQMVSFVLISHPSRRFGRRAFLFFLVLFCFVVFCSYEWMLIKSVGRMFSRGSSFLFWEKPPLNSIWIQKKIQLALPHSHSFFFSLLHSDCINCVLSDWFAYCYSSNGPQRVHVIELNLPVFFFTSHSHIRAISSAVFFFTDRKNSYIIALIQIKSSLKILNQQQKMRINRCYHTTNSFASTRHQVKFESKAFIYYIVGWHFFFHACKAHLYEQIFRTSTWFVGSFICAVVAGACKSEN